MDLILFSCKARLQSYFRQKRTQRILLLLLGIAMSVFYSWMFSYLLQKAHEGGINPSVEKVLGYTNLFILAITIMRSFFPAYIPKTEFIHRIYPIKPMQKFWVELVVELASPFYFVLVSFLLMLFILSPDYGVGHLLQSLMVFLTAHITRRSLQLLVERRIKWRQSAFITAAIMAGAFVALQVREPMYEPITSPLLLIVHLAALGFFTASSYFLEQAAFEPKQKVVSYSQNSRRSLAWRLFKNNKIAKQLILFGLAFKVLMLAADAGAYTTKGVHLYDQNISIWMFVGPLVLYTYVFNNVWGFYKTLWLTTERASGNIIDFLKASLMPLRVPLLLDAGLVVLYVAFFNKEHAVFILLMYFTSVLVLTPIGIIASFLSPKVVRGGVMSFGAKTSYLYTFISILLIGLLFLPLLHPLLYLVYPVVIGITIFAVVAVLKEYPKYKYQLFERLYKTEV
ncbi:hypothetical protein [Pontibacter vulgaris]|uniref:hypothetical protein n=1 Tax=Pontibacter vulgaris TaxID=2905679 RepID=UPI001FA7BC22|nr:hypothetical protein [Pontibacter vulgaris]